MIGNKRHGLDPRAASVVHRHDSTVTTASRCADCTSGMPCEGYELCPRVMASWVAIAQAHLACRAPSEPQDGSLWRTR